MYFFDGENISFDASLVIYINSINIPPITNICFVDRASLYNLVNKANLVYHFS